LEGEFLKYYDYVDLMFITTDVYMRELEQKLYPIDLTDIVELYDYGAEHFTFEVESRLFASALNEIFGYDVYSISYNDDSYIFCKSANGEYIDVRGRTKSFRRFIGGTSLADFVKSDISERYTFADDDFLFDYSGILLEFARLIIKHDMGQYSV
jgi:hypothetical protein